MKEKNYHIFFTNLANPLKIRIVQCLREGEKSVGDLCKCLGMEQSKISHALASLRHCSIVKMEQKGKQRIYGLNKETVLPILQTVDKHTHKFCRGECVVKKA